MDFPGILNRQTNESMQPDAAVAQCAVFSRGVDVVFFVLYGNQLF